MSCLLSICDVEDTIEALEFLLETKGNDFVEVKRNRICMLLAWMKLKRSQQYEQKS